MSNLQIINELCGICADLAHIIAAQRNVLEQHNALIAEDEIAKAQSRYVDLVGTNEWQDDIKQGDKNHG